MKTTLLLSLLFAVLPLSMTIHAGTLAERAAKEKTEWMIGKWATEEGNVSISYTWKLDKNMVAVAFKLGDREAEGMIVQKPGTDKVIYNAADNKGGVTTGEWIQHNGNPTLVSTSTDAEGKEVKIAAEHIKTDADTMTVKLYKQDASGRPEGDPVREVVFKRQKQEAEKR
jgi:hypothetical protein